MPITRHVRALQSRFPRFVDAKASAQRFMRRTLRRPFEPEFSLLSRWRPDPGEVFIDVGAHRGQSVDAIRLYQPDALIHAFEPNVHLANGLAHLFDDDPALAVYACGLGDKDEARRLYVPVYRSFVYDGLASFDPDQAGGWLSAHRISGFDPDQLEMMAGEARTFTLDMLGLNPGFLKIDAPGWFASVVRGAEDTLDRCRPLILMQTNERADQVLTEERGYTRAAFDGDRLRPGEEGFENTVYVPGERMGDLTRCGLWPA
ncbi:FkbM family methyltransferase [Oceanicaulis sp.]|uniref:FkbM family methyltransferase n=1 Tax=Oceanicaulis sp. TaxID=1924941 RepID=UPI003BAD5992